MIEGLDLALGVTTGAYARQSSPEVRLDTLRGHAPPVQHSVPRGAPSDSGEFTKGSTQVLSTDQALLATNHGAHTAAPEEPAHVPSPPKRWIVGGVFAVLALLAGVALLLGRNNGVQPKSEDVVPPSAQPTALASVATTPTLPPTTVASEQPAAASSAATVANKQPPIRVTAPKSPVPTARTNKAVSKALSPSPVSATGNRNTNTDMGF